MTHKKWVVNTFRSLFPKKRGFIPTLKINPIKSWAQKENNIFDPFNVHYLIY